MASNISLGLTRSVYFLLAMLIVAITGCSTIDKLTHFNMSYDLSVVIPSATGIGLPVDLVTPEMESNSESTFAINDTRKDMIEEIVLTDLELTLTEPADGDFSFLESISVYINAEGLEEIKIAWLDEVPPVSQTNLILDTSNEDLQEYIKSVNFSLRLQTVTDEIITTDHHIDVHTVFFVDARVLGI